MKKILAAFLTITLPIWVIPFAIAYLSWEVISGTYEAILKAIE